MLRDQSWLALRVPPLLFWMVWLLLMWCCVEYLPRGGIWKPDYRLALLPGLFGLVLVLLGVLHFRRAKTTVNPTRPQATVQLVTRGVYRYSRNPMYLGFGLLLLGVGLAWGNVFALLLLPLFVCYLNRYQIEPEEQVLHQQFGEVYAVYCQRVRRWL